NHCKRHRSHERCGSGHRPTSARVPHHRQLTLDRRLGESPMPTFTGDQIAAERQRRGWSRRQMSDATGLSQGVIKNLEDGRAPRDWEVAVLEAFVAGQEVTPDMLGEKKETRGRPPKDGATPQAKAAPTPKAKVST